MKTRPHSRVLFSIGILLVLLTSCDKEDFLKNPASMSFSFAMDADAIGGLHDLTFDSASIVLSSFTVIGDRFVAEDYEFTRTFPTGLSLDLRKFNTLKELQFDLPQGEYEKITLRFETSQLYMRGHCVYSSPQKTEATIYLKVEEPKQFEMKITNTLGNAYLSLQGFVTKNPQIIFKPKDWFELIPETMFENATVFYLGNQRSMDIGTNDNPLIFDIINSNIAPSTKCFLHP